MKIKSTILLVAVLSIITVLTVLSTSKRTAANPANAAAINISTNGFNFVLTKEMIPTLSGNYVHSVSVDLGNH